MVIKVLGSGCKNCSNLEENVKKALTELSMQADVVKVTDFADIARYNALKTPALVIDEKLVSFGKVNDVNEIKSFLA
ncbi:MAG: thioredoxin family protein [Bdellovibrionaceae bacterium]|nr:thioredoxin family protein [Pseudobdellovibrionaceae bacterium]